MIAPLHPCWWSAQKTVKIEAAGRSLHLAGVSLPVVMDAFAGNTATRWYTRLYGDVHHGAHENLLIVGVDEGNAARSLDDLGDDNPFHGSQRYADDSGPLRTIRTDTSPFDEWELAESALDSFLLESGANEFLKYADYYIHLHDDCFAEVAWRRTDDSLLVLVVRGLLRLQSYYLGKEVDWQNVLEAIARFVTAHGEVRITANASESTLTLTSCDRTSFSAERHVKIKENTAAIVSEP